MFIRVACDVVDSELYTAIFKNRTNRWEGK